MSARFAPGNTVVRNDMSRVMRMLGATPTAITKETLSGDGRVLACVPLHVELLDAPPHSAVSVSPFLSLMVFVPALPPSISFALQVQLRRLLVSHGPEGGDGFRAAGLP